MGCISGKTLFDHLTGELKGDRASHVADHLSSCDSCRERLNAMQRQIDTVTEAFSSWGPGEIPERPDCYPECTMFGTLPAYGFYARHVAGLTLRDIDVRFDKDDRRPALYCDDVRNLSVNGLAAETRPDSAPIIILANTETAWLMGCIAPIDTGVFCRLAGRTSRISAVGNDLSQAKTPFQRSLRTPVPVAVRAAARRTRSPRTGAGF